MGRERAQRTLQYWNRKPEKREQTPGEGGRPFRAAVRHPAVFQMNQETGQEKAPRTLEYWK